MRRAVALGSLILMWAEFYGSLNPMRVALYHAMAIFVGEVVKWLFMGMSVPYLAFFSIVLPIVCLACVRSSMTRLPERDLPPAMKEGDPKTIPWKPILLMAVCTFAGGFGALPTQLLVAWATCWARAGFVTALVFFGVLSASRWFNFDTIYQLAFSAVHCRIPVRYAHPSGRTRKSWRCATMRATPCFPCTS